MKTARYSEKSTAPKLPKAVGETEKDENRTHVCSPVPIVLQEPLSGILDCCHFLATNEYSDETIGVDAVLTRRAVGEINFSDVVELSERRSRAE
jgi:hypothetical protein